MADAFDALVAEKHYPWKIREILPQVLHAGQPAGTLTPEGAKLLDPAGLLSPGVPLAPLKETRVLAWLLPTLSFPAPAMCPQVQCVCYDRAGEALVQGLF